MSKSVLAGAVLGLFAAVLISCGSKKDASKSNFKVAIQEELDQEPQCISASLPREMPSWNGNCVQSDTSLLVLSFSMAVAASEIIAQAKMNTVIDVDE